MGTLSDFVRELIRGARDETNGVESQEASRAPERVTSPGEPRSFRVVLAKSLGHSTGYRDWDIRNVPNVGLPLIAGEGLDKHSAFALKRRADDQIPEYWTGEFEYLVIPDDEW